MALGLAESEYAPDLVQHIPGVMNKAPDMLSRFADPGHNFIFPEVLAKARRAHPARRDAAWWRADDPASYSRE